MGASEHLKEILRSFQSCYGHPSLIVISRRHVFTLNGILPIRHQIRVVALPDHVWEQDAIYLENTFSNELAHIKETHGEKENDKKETV